MTDPVIFNQYNGNYTSKDTSLPDVLIFTEKNKLYWEWQKAGDLPTELIPYSKTEYFMAENERILFTFKKENNKSTMVLVPEDKVEYYFTKKNKRLM